MATTLQISTPTSPSAREFLQSFVSDLNTRQRNGFRIDIRRAVRSQMVTSRSPPLFA
jgi:hypothetical protein